MYRLTDFTKVREVTLQRPFERIWANGDGSRLIASEPNYVQGRIIDMDADSLWPKVEIPWMHSPVQSIYVIP